MFFDTSDSVTVAVAFLVIIGVYKLWSQVFERDPMVRRLQKIREREGEFRTTLHQEKGPGRAIGGKEDNGIADYFLSVDQIKQMRALLGQAGYSVNSLTKFVLIKICTTLGLAAIATLIIHVKGYFPDSNITQLLVVFLGMGAGWFIPDWIVGRAAEKRQKLIEKGFADALDILTICTEAGLSLDESLERVTPEIAKISPELGYELGLTRLELSFMPSRRAALTSLSERATAPIVAAFVNTVTQSEQYGTPVSQSLRVLAGEYRQERMLRAEEKGARLPAILTVPMIVFILPTLFIVLLGPAILKMKDFF